MYFIKKSFSMCVAGLFILGCITASIASAKTYTKFQQEAGMKLIRKVLTENDFHETRESQSDRAEAGRKPNVQFKQVSDEFVYGEEIANESGQTLKRLWLVRRQNLKHPLIRIHELYGKDPVTGTQKLQKKIEMAADHLIVKLKPGKNKQRISSVGRLERSVENWGGKLRKTSKISKVILVEFDGSDPANFERIQNNLRQDPDVEYVEPNYVVYAFETLPNDRGFDELWGMHNTGQSGGTPDADIDAPEAWEISTGSHDVAVAVIDTGVDYAHPDLASNIWTNPGETGVDANGQDKTTNGIDDDGNGYTDDWHGWNFVDDNNDPMDDAFHGTHCAGTIGAVGNNEEGVAGVCWNVSIVPLKFLHYKGYGFTLDGAESIMYAVKIGARMMSLSWGGPSYSRLLKDAIDEAEVAGILCIAAAGNKDPDDPSIPSYPAAYDNPNIIAVAATDHDDKLAEFSEYGETIVDLAAPGDDIYSTFPTWWTPGMQYVQDNGGRTFSTDYESISGTSMATPHVAGACAMLMGLAEDQLTPELAKKLIFESADPVEDLQGKTITGGRLNLYEACTIGFVIVESYIDDDSVEGTIGNADGIVNPGERIGFSPDLLNWSPDELSTVTARLTIQGSDPYVEISRDTVDYGTIAPYATKSTGQFLLDISANAPSSHEVSCTLEITDENNRVRTHVISIWIYESYEISGTVMVDDQPGDQISVNYSGTLSGEVEPSADGNFSFNVIPGAYNIYVTVEDVISGKVVEITAPPGNTDLDFDLKTLYINGNVRDSVDNKGIKAKVKFSGDVDRSLITDDNGNYETTVIADKQEQILTLRVIPIAWREIQRKQASQDVTILAGERSRTINVEIQPLVYEVRDLGTLGNGELGSYALGINNLGDVAGYSYLQDDSHSPHAVLWRDGKIIELGSLEDYNENSVAEDINDAGQIVGWSEGEYGSHAFIWEDGTGISDLDAVDDRQRRAFHINNSGSVVGTIWDEEKNVNAAFLWEQGITTDIGSSFSSDSGAHAINDNGQIVGAFRNESGGFKAYLWESGSVQVQPAPWVVESSAMDLNEAGQIVLYAFLRDKETGRLGDYGLFWHEETVQEICPSNYYFCYPNSINDSGQIVGLSLRGITDIEGAMWEFPDRDSMVPLNDMIPQNSGWRILDATDINNSGQIVGWGILDDVGRCAVLLTPKTTLIYSPNRGTVFEPGQSVTARGMFTNLSWQVLGIGNAGEQQIASGSGEQITFTVPQGYTSRHGIKILLTSDKGSDEKVYSVANMKISNIDVDSGRTYRVVYDGLRIGTRMHSDDINRRYMYFKTIPENLVGVNFIKTSARDRDSDGADVDFLRFDINSGAMVYVAHDDTITEKPAWLADFIDTGQDLTTIWSEEVSTFSLFKKKFEAGTVALGGNNNNGDVTKIHMYGVIVVPYPSNFTAYIDLNSQAGDNNQANVLAIEPDFDNPEVPIDPTIHWALKDFDTGFDLPVTMQVEMDVRYPTNNGADSAGGTDADQLFGDIVDGVGGYEIDIGDPDDPRDDDYVRVTFNNLDPEKEYVVAVTYNRDGGTNYTDRVTRFAISGADTYTNVSTTGVVVNPEGSVASFSTGNNTAAGYVAQWTGVIALDGSFSISAAQNDSRPEWQGRKAYAMTSIMLEQIIPLNQHFIATSSSDASDANPGNGVCDTGFGECTLRAAVEEANALLGANKIFLPEGTHRLSKGALNITDDLILIGAGNTGETTVIDGEGRDRVIHTAADSVTLEGLVIKNGSADEGGGILNSQAELTITNCTISHNHARLGAGLFNNGGAVIIQNSTIEFNTASQDGGGIFEDGSGSWITDTTIAFNTASQHGGGICFDSSETYIDYSTISENSGGNISFVAGGGIVELQNSILGAQSEGCGSPNQIISLGNNVICLPFNCSISQHPDDNWKDCSSGLTAYNDLAWAPGQMENNITKITSPNGGSGLPNYGELLNFSTGKETGVWLEVTGGKFNGSSHATQYSGSPDEGDAYDVFNGKLDAMGSISYNSEGLELSFSGMDPYKTYTLVFYGHRNKYEWDRASLVTISGADDFTNQSSAADDNPRDDCGDGGGRIFCGLGYDSTRLPADNDYSYVARFTGIDPGDDGEVVLTISWDGTLGSEDKGKYANAVMLMEEPPFVAYNDLTWAPGQMENNITKITSPNGGSGLPNYGELLNFSTGNETGVWLEVTGGKFNGSSHATQYSGSPDEGDAYDVFNGKLDAMGSISYNSEDVELSFSGMDPYKTYTLVFYGHRDKYGWDRASLVTISGADDFTNQSSAADDNPRDDCGDGGGRIFCGLGYDSTRLPADNDYGYVARFTGIDPGDDGEVVLTISWDGTLGSEDKGKYANAVMLMEEPQ